MNRQPVELPPEPFSPLPLIGRRQELRALQALLQQGNRALVLGPRGIGKTRLAEEACAACGARPARLVSPATAQDLLRQLLPQISAWPAAAELRRLSSQSMQARALEALRLRPQWLWIDAPQPASPHLYRFLQRVLWIDGCGLLVSAIHRGQLGYLGRLLWDPRQEITLQPLPRASSAALLEAAMSAFGLAALPQMEQFRRQALAAGAGNPGRIVALCRLGAQAQYWRAGHLLFTPLWMDVLTQLV